MILFQLIVAVFHLSAVISDEPFIDSEFQSLDNGSINTVKRVVVIEPKSLENILNFKIPLQYYDKNFSTDKHTTLLSLFTDYLIPFDFYNDSNNNVVQRTAEYNKKRHTNDSINSTINLWISFIPKGDIDEDLDTVLNAVTKANEIHPETVSTLVLNYGFLLLDSESVSVVIHDINKFSQKVKALKGMNLVLGIQLDILNCQNRKEYIEMLDASLIDGYLFLPQESRKDAYTSITNLKISVTLALTSCIIAGTETSDVLSLLALDTFITVDVNLQEGFYNFDRSALAELIEFFDIRSAEPLIFYAVVDNVNTEKRSKYISKSIDFHNWIQLPIKFSNLHFGALISLQDVPANWTRFIPILLHTFRNIIIEDHVHGQKSHDFVLDLIKYNMATQNKSRHHNYDFNYYSNENLSLKISLIVTLNSNVFLFNKQQVDNVISVAAAGNKLSPGSVDALYLYRTSYNRSSDYSGYELGDDCRNLQLNTNLQMLVYYTKIILCTKKDNLHTFSVGKVVDNIYWKGVFVAAECNQNTLPNNTVAETALADSIAEATIHESLDFIEKFDENDAFPVLICRSVIYKTNILKNGAEKTASLTIKELNGCATNSKILNATVLYYINIIGCNNESRSNITQLAEYVLTLEILSTWAVAANKTLFVNAGMENATQCNEPSQLKDCHCGWWIRTQGNNDELFLDKKSIALQLYENLSAKVDNISKHTHWKLFLILFLALLLTTFITALTVYLVLHYRAKDIISKQEVADFINGSKKQACENNYGEIDGQGEAQSAAFNRQKYDIASNLFTIDQSHCLGSGEFGKIFLGTIRRNDEMIEIAVKMANSQGYVKNHGYYMAVKGLISEIKILAFVGNHRHIISLLGAYTENLRKGKLAVFLELCPLGSLDKYLRAYKPQANNINSEHDHIPESSNSINDSPEMEMETFGLNTEMSDDLCRWAGEVACAMEFLSSKKLVHADLAARNVLLTADKTAKISDFGLSRRLYDYTEYVKQNQAPLPWRWMSPESLRRLVFNEKSDVWAYGVTLWELFTLGDEPYPGLSWTVDFPMVLDSGIRLPAPRYNVKQIYSIMVRCWSYNPVDRPTFSELKSELYKEPI